jgi:hypothetical protein
MEVEAKQEMDVVYQEHAHQHHHQQTTLLVVEVHS